MYPIPTHIVLTRTSWLPQWKPYLAQPWLSFSLLICPRCVQVADPSNYGVVVMDESGLVDRFVEKPKAGAMLRLQCPACTISAHAQSLSLQ